MYVSMHSGGLYLILPCVFVFLEFLNVQVMFSLARLETEMSVYECVYNVCNTLHTSYHQSVCTYRPGSTLVEE